MPNQSDFGVTFGLAQLQQVRGIHGGMRQAVTDCQDTDGQPRAGRFWGDLQNRLRAGNDRICFVPDFDDERVLAHILLRRNKCPTLSLLASFRTVHVEQIV